MVRASSKKIETNVNTTRRRLRSDSKLGCLRSDVPSHPTPPVRFTNSVVTSSSAGAPETHRLAPESGISRTRAYKEYRVTSRDLRGLETTDSRRFFNGDAYDVELYRERDVERVAWTRHGGRAGFVAYLRVLYKRHRARLKESKTPFALPNAYLSEVLSIGVPTVRTHTADHDHTPTSRTLISIKSSMPIWLWNKCSAFLDLVEARSSSKRPLPLKTREEAMHHAKEFARSYPPRPSSAVPRSPWIDALRIVLADSPQPPSRENWGKPVEGLLGVLDCHGRCTAYVWDEHYYRRLFTALRNVVHAHGMGNMGWAGVRWEVYEAHTEGASVGISYNPQRHGEKWVDTRAQMLTREFLDEGLKKYCGIINSAKTPGDT
ncbi:hypothetical protein C8Q79DRAFT_194836 [Trametes meyenii]|nr:hypothetical protein C8Q79DRAFT_194836 [Trametes meyenii]